MMEMEALAYKCPNCSGDLQFSAKSQMFDCQYCGSSFTEAEMKELAAAQEAHMADQTEEERQEEQENASEFNEHTNEYFCESCGAAVMAEETTAATFCYYCHNPIILKGRVAGEFRPSYVLPFQIDRNEAVGQFKGWCKKHKFLPRDFMSQAQQEKIVGLYVPFWVTDVDVNAEMDALGKKVRSWTSGSYRYTETREYAVARKAKIKLRGLPADGASHIADDLMEAVEPFDYRQTVPFAMQYLSGFLAERYDMNMAAMFPRIQKRAVQACDQLVRGSMTNYSSVSVTRSDVKVMGTTWEYMLLPVWFMTYKYKDQIYEFALNGQTGKFVGNPPLDKPRLGLISALIGLGVAALTVLVGVFMA